MVIDTIFGWIKGFKNKNWSSFKAKWGIAGKITELILISLLYILNWVFNVDFIVYIGLYYFVACEIASILENYSHINKNLPKGLINILKKLQFNIGTFFINELKLFIQKFADEKSNTSNNKRNDKDYF